MNIMYLPSARLFRFSPESINVFNMLIDDEMKGMVLWECLVCMKKVVMGCDYNEDPLEDSLDYLESILFDASKDGSINYEEIDDLLKMEFRERAEEVISMMMESGKNIFENEDALLTLDDAYSGYFKWALSDSGLLTLIY